MDDAFSFLDHWHALVLGSLPDHWSFLVAGCSRFNDNDPNPALTGGAAGESLSGAQSGSH
jgi:hypothetical protein